jgi:hypothetical protein
MVFWKLWRIKAQYHYTKKNWAWSDLGTKGPRFVSLDLQLSILKLRMKSNVVSTTGPSHAMNPMTRLWRPFHKWLHTSS